MRKKTIILIATIMMQSFVVLNCCFGESSSHEYIEKIIYVAAQTVNESIDSEENEKNKAIRDSEEDIFLGLQLLEQEDIANAMKHFLRALPNEKAEKLIADNALDYLDELMFSEDYQTAQEFMIKHPFDGCEQILAKCNDYCFLKDLAKGLVTRWENSDKDTSIWSDEKVREWLHELIGYERQYIDKYISLGFSDPQLANLAYAYIGSLQSQQTAIPYYGLDTEKYNEYWYDHGYNVSSRLVYLINRKYGIEMNSSLNKKFKEVLQYGQLQDFVYAVSKSFMEQLSNVDILFYTARSGNKDVIKIQPFRMYNSSGYSLTQFIVEAVFLDDNGKEIINDDGKSNAIFWNVTEETRDGSDFSWVDNRFYYPFSSFYFRCSFSDTSNSWYTCNVFPSQTYTWDGKEIGANRDETGISIKSQVLVDEAESYWTMHNNTFVPCLEFIVRNNGKDYLSEASVECIFIDKDNNTEWTREKYLAISAADMPLRSGQGRRGIVYSARGYDSKTRKVPNLAVKIYVNGDMIEETDVSKP